MANMRFILRWHGEKDPVSLKQYAQVPGIYGVVTSLYHMSLGEIWDKKEVLKLVQRAGEYGLKLEIVDSFRIHEDIKRGYPTRDRLIENYKANIRMLAECGIKIICYNFMPVFDWTRTDLEYKLPDGSDCLAFEAEKVNKIPFAAALLFITLPLFVSYSNVIRLQACKRVVYRLPVV